MKNSYLFSLHRKYHLNLSCWLVTLLIGVLSTLSASAQVSGTVFKDFNANGTQQTTTAFTEPGVSGIVVKAFNAASTQVGSTTTSAAGAYTFTGLTLPLRIEFTLPATYYATKGNVGNTTIQFYSAASTTANLSVSDPDWYWDNTKDPLYSVPCYVNGTSTAGGADAAIVATPYSSSKLNAMYPDGFGVQGTGTVPKIVATAAQVGTVWGEAYQKNKQQMFFSTFLKRHSGMADGPGYIYVFNYSTTTPSLAKKFNLEGVTPANGGAAIQLGSVCRDATCATAAGNTGIVADYTLPSNKLNPSVDLDAFGKVGKMAYGDIDMEPGTDNLWAVNLFQQALLKIDVSGNAASLPGPVSQYILASLPGYPTSSTGVLRPWGLAFNNGKGYLGVVSDASISKNNADLKAYILSFDPTNVAAGFTVELNFDPNIKRDASGGNSFHYWLSTWSTTLISVDGYYSTPALSDIDFDANGNMYLSFMDRFGHQVGSFNYRAISKDVTTSTQGVALGDILKACATATGFTIEGTGTCVPGTGSGSEFFQDTAGDTDAESAEGATAILKGTNQLLVLSVDPHPQGVTGQTYWSSQGTNTYNLTTGQIANWYSVYQGDAPLYGKANGLGDLEFVLPVAPIEIGNRVWNDTDNDGIQDAGETGIAGVSVSLCTGIGTPIATAITDANGNYYFSNATGTSTGSAIYSLTGLTDNTGYQLKFPTTTSGKSLVTANATADNIDSDASASGIVSFSTASLGANNHTFDVGYGAASCSLTATAVPTTCVPATNLYAVSGTISLTSNTAGGVATITDGAKSATVTVAASATSVAYSLTGLTSNGAIHAVTISLVGCGSAVVGYTAPASCAVATSSSTCTDSQFLFIADYPVGSASGTLHIFDFPYTGTMVNSPTYSASACAPGVNTDASEGITVDEVGKKIYVTSVGASQISVYSSAGLLGSFTLPSDYALSLDVDPLGHYLYIAAQHGLYKYDVSNGVPTSYVTFSSNATLGLSGDYLWGVSVSPTNGNVYVTSGWNPSDFLNGGATTTTTRILAIDHVTLTPISTVVSLSKFPNLFAGITVAADGSLWVVNNNVVEHRNATTGTIISSIATSAPAANSGSPDSPLWAITLGPDGNVYVGSGATTACVYQINPILTSSSIYIPYDNSQTSLQRAKGLAFLCSAITCPQPACALTATATPGTCNSATNQYTVSGTISLTNAVAGTATITDGTKSTTVAITASATSVAYSLSGLTSGTGSHTITVSLPGCGTATATYAAPASCSVAPLALAIVVSIPACNSLTNTYTTTGTVSLSNATAGTLTITDNGTTIGTISVTAGQTTASFSASGVSNTASHTVIATLTGGTSASTTYTAPSSCTVCSTSLVTTAVANGQVGTAYSQTVTATGGTAPYTYSVLGTLPAGLTLNPTTGVIAGVPTTATTTSFTVRVSDTKSCTDVQPLTITIANLPVCSLTATVTPGVCNSATNQYAVTGSVSSTNAAINSASPQTLTVSVGSINTVVTLTGNGPVSYTLTGLTSDGAAHTVSVLSSATACGSTSVSFTAPASCSVAPPKLAIVVGTPVCNSVTNNYTATGTVSLSNATAGTLTITDNGTTIGTITVTAGQTTASFSASGVSNTASHTVIATLTGGTSASTTYAAPASCTVCNLTLTANSLPIGKVGNAYSATLTATNGTAPYAYSVVANSLPAGLVLNPATGVVSGTPTTSGSFPTTIAISDAKGCSVTLPLTVLQIDLADVCSLSLVVTPGLCTSATNTYSLAGSVTLTNPVAGVLTITDGGKSTTMAVTAASTSVTYSLSGLPSGSGLHTLVATLAGCSSTSSVYAAPVSCTAGAPTYAIAKSVNLGRVTKGGIVTYTVSLTNTGNATGTNLVITDQLSTTAVTFVGSATTSVGTFAPSGNSGNWSIPSLAAGQVATLAMQVQLNAEGITYNTATAPDGTTAAVCTTVPFQVCASESFEFTLSVTPGRPSYQWSKDGMPIAGATANTLSVTALGEYTVSSISSGSCPDGSCCPFVIESVGALPSLTAVASAATCTGSIPLNDAKITLAGSSTNAVSYNISAGSSFTASASLFATNQALATVVGGVLKAGLANPVLAPGDTYTIRVYSAGGCFSDTLVVVPPAQCQCPSVCIPLKVRRLK